MNGGDSRKLWHTKMKAENCQELCHAKMKAYFLDEGENGVMQGTCM
jgi:hypothetical protein